MNTEDFDKEFDDLHDFFDEKSIRYSTAAREKAENPQWRKKHKEAVQLRNQSKEYQKKLQEVYNSKSWQENRLKRIRENNTDEEYKRKRQKGIEKFLNDPVRFAEWKHNLEAKRDIINAKRKKRMQTPDGIFDGMIDVAKFYGITKGSVQSRMNNHPDKYYYIDENGNKLPPRKYGKRKK